MTAPVYPYPTLDDEDRELSDLCYVASVEAAGDGDMRLAAYLRAGSEWHEDQIASRQRAA